MKIFTQEELCNDKSYARTWELRNMQIEEQFPKKARCLWSTSSRYFYWKSTFASCINIQYFFALDAMEPAF